VRYRCGEKGSLISSEVVGQSLEISWGGIGCQAPSQRAVLNLATLCGSLIMHAPFLKESGEVPWHVWTVCSFGYPRPAKFLFLPTSLKAGSRMRDLLPLESSPTAQLKGSSKYATFFATSSEKVDYGLFFPSPSVRKSSFFSSSQYSYRLWYDTVTPPHEIIGFFCSRTSKGLIFRKT